MSRGKIVIKTFGGRINIVPREETRARAPAPGRPSEAAPAGAPGAVPSPPAGGPALKGLALSSQMVQLMEIRAESIFRPNEEDYEIAYALSGSSSDALDMLHKLASNEVVSSATPESVQPIARAMVSHVNRERGDSPKIIIDVHTHPKGIPQPSDADRRAFLSEGPFVRSLVPGVQVLFAVHAVSSESMLSREAPAKTGGNRIRWTSITREHEVAFFDENSAPYEVRLHG